MTNMLTTKFKTQKDTDDFLEYIEEYDTYYNSDSKTTDEDNIEINLEQ